MAWPLLYASNVIIYYGFWTPLRLRDFGIYVFTIIDPRLRLECKLHQISKWTLIATCIRVFHSQSIIIIMNIQSEHNPSNKFPATMGHERAHFALNINLTSSCTNNYYKWINVYAPPGIEEQGGKCNPPPPPLQVGKGTSFLTPPPSTKNIINTYYIMRFAVTPYIETISCEYNNNNKRRTIVNDVINKYL